MSRAGAVFHVIGSLLLVGPKLALRFIRALFHADGIARDAERIADGLCREGKSLLGSASLKGAEILFLYKLGNGLAVVVKPLLRPFRRLHDIAGQHGEIRREVVAPTLTELVKHPWRPVLRSSFMRIHRDAADSTMRQRVEQHLNIAVPMQIGRLLRQFVTLVAQQVLPAML